MPEYEFDVAVIGAGPGGEGAAMQAAKQGKSVVAVERYTEIGGGCTHWGTIPSKALRYAIFRMADINNNRLFHEAGVAVNLTFPQLRATAEEVIVEQVSMRQAFYERNGVEVVHGEARFVDEHTVEVRRPDGGMRRMTAAGVVIATGSRPYRPPNVDFSHPRVFDSDTILDLSHTPRSITIVGAGVVGCEYASMFRNLAVKVNLVNSRDKLLDFLDDEIIDALAYHLRDHGVLIRHRENYQRVEALDDGVVLHLESGKQFKTDALFMAIGRSGNTEALNLSAIGLEANHRGQLVVNDDFQTAVPHIYAVGDVIGYPALASAAYVQGRYAAGHMINGHFDRSLVQDHPTGIYTTPEISSLGKTERELTEAKVPYEVGQAMFKCLARRKSRGKPSACSNCCSTARRSRCWASTVSAPAPRRSSTSAKPSWPNPARPTRYVISSTQHSTIPPWPKPTA